jgi:hypothetical protein
MTPNKQRKASVQRLYKGLVGLPPEPVTMPLVAPVQNETSDKNDSVTDANKTSGSSPGGSQKSKPLQSLAGSSPNEPDQPVAEPVLSAPAHSLKRGPGRRPLGARAMTPAERKAKERAEDKRSQTLEVLVKVQKTDDITGGAYGPGRTMKDAPSKKGLILTGGNRANRAIAVADQMELEETEFGANTGEERGLEEGRRRQRNTSYGNDGGETGSEILVDDISEYEETFQRRHKVGKNWKFDERYKQELARLKVVKLTVPSSMAEFVWDVGTSTFVCVEALLWCRVCHKLVPTSFRCRICHEIFWSLKAATEHIVDFGGNDETHRRRILKDLGRPHFIPNVNNRVRKLAADAFAESYHRAVVDAEANGWVKLRGEWVRK